MFRSLLLVGSILGVCILTTVAVHADSPREFLYKAQQGNNSEIMLGRLAAERARNPAVREYGQTLVSEHRQARDEVRALGSKFGMRPNRDPSPEAIEARERLITLNGRRFDREFIRHMVEDHEKDIAEFREEAREGHGEVSELARRHLPTLRHHLEMARALDNERSNFDGSSDRTDRGGWRRNDDNYENQSTDRNPNR
jgi:putative membrane protein